MLRVSTVLALLVWAVLVLPGQAAERLPNVVVIVADDLGLEGVQAYGGLSYQTPNIDALAEKGMRFTHCFSNPLCSPSRAQLLTGRYPFRNGIKRVIYQPENHREFLDPTQETSFATLLKQAGYATAIAGKWQVSFLHERDTVPAHGFDEYQMWQIFHEGKKTSRYADPTMRQNGKVLQTELKGKYGPDVNVAFLCDFMRRHQDQPFLVYYTALLPHYPWEPTPDSKDDLQPATGDGDRKYMPDMVAYLDKQVGQLVATLEELKLRENTLVLFVADNGTDRRVVSRWSNGTVTRNVPGGKGTMTDAGTRVPLIANWPGVIAAGKVNDDLIDLSDLLPTLVELTGAPLPSKPIDGHSFLPQLRSEPGSPREWIHVQDKQLRYLRNRDFILTWQGQLRPVVEIGQPKASVISPPYNSQQKQAHIQLMEAQRGSGDSF
ncbi:arylsulfatase A [Bremerella cremea]|uniref:Arylsulfatase A n=1 Tax=Bremerella cremea TaxID=1031537 RepID=A0A368KJ53_9BACT|nr:sulfatase-like hydrolase/transferase [Bremerella cremea]RCS40593.1 arylsulfatase A [Bremerella cremea]